MRANMEDRVNSGGNFSDTSSVNKSTEIEVFFTREE